jgi:hypothetical protein
MVKIKKIINIFVLFPDTVETNPTEGFTVIVVDVAFEQPFDDTVSVYV